MRKGEKRAVKGRMVCQVDETRDAIIRAARVIFTGDGLFDPEMKDIARAAGISRSSLYRYYRDKAGLAMAVLETIVRDIRDKIYPGVRDMIEREGITGLRKLERCLLDTWLSPALSVEIKFFAEFDAYFTGSRAPAGFTDRIADIFQTRDDPYVLACLEQGIEDGSIRSDIDPHLAMVTLVDAVRGLRQRLALRGNLLIELREGEQERMMRELLRYLLAGLAAG